MSESGSVHISCLCGRVRMTADLPTERIGHCHCDNCRRAHGAGVWTWATFKTESLRVLAGAEALKDYRSDTDAIRQFCTDCGSTLTYASPRWPGVIDVSLANIDDPVGAEPTRHAYADRAPAWSPILDDLQKLGGPTGVEPID